MKHILTTGALTLALTATALGQTATMGPQTSVYSPNTRGYWFTAPSDFVITGVRVLAPTGSANAFQNFAILHFDGNAPPPPFNATTDLFTQLALGFDLDQTVFQPVNVQVLTGDVIGIYGNTAAGIGSLSGQNSYAGLTQQTTMIAGTSVDLFRSGMQFHLGDATTPLGMQAVWAEPGSFNISRVEFMYVPGGGTIGTNYCMANNNSTGTHGVMAASGSANVASNDMSLVGTDLPQSAWGFFIVSDTQGFVPTPGGSAGNLCLGGQIGRYVGAGQIQNTGAAGELTLAIDNQQMPSPTGFFGVVPGDVLNFQCWHRDIGMPATSNFTDGLEITFL